MKGYKPTIHELSSEDGSFLLELGIKKTSSEEGGENENDKGNNSDKVKDS